MTKQVVAVLGGTGLQGGGVVNALVGSGRFAVRVASRNPASDAARALAARGVEVVKADLLDPSSLRSALEAAHGAFVVTNFWDPAQMSRETEIGTAAVQAARAAGVGINPGCPARPWDCSTTARVRGRVPSEAERRVRS
jgi:uncharacterized protein YbjT (DUF2867 family)